MLWQFSAIKVTKIKNAFETKFKNIDGQFKIRIFEIKIDFKLVVEMFRLPMVA